MTDRPHTTRCAAPGLPPNSPTSSAACSPTSSSLRDLKQGEVLAREGTVDNHLYVILGRRWAWSRTRAPIRR